jgi:hypothetical protein
MNNQKYVSVDVIAYELGQLYRSKNWEIGNIRTWCAEVETRYIKDIETMTSYKEIDLTVNFDANGKPQVLLPCNVFRNLDIYENSSINLEFDTNGSYAYNFKWNGITQTYNVGDFLYINYEGVNIDEATGEILVVKGHEIACKTWCKIQMFEEDSALGKFDKNLVEVWKNDFSGQCIAARHNYQHKSRQRIDNLNIIRGNMVTNIAGLSLHHELFL